MAASVFGSSNKNAPGIGGRIFGCLFGLAFAGFGGFFVWMATLNPFLTYLDGQSWTETPATILRSELQSDGDDLELGVRYEYEVDGRQYTSEEMDLLSKNRDYAAVQKLGKELSEGLETVAFVNPDDPSEAVLFRDLNSSIFIGLFALLFVFAGLGIAGFSLFATSKKDRQKGFSKGVDRKWRPGLVLFSVPFIGMGSAFFWFGGLDPLLRSRSAADWPEVPCTIDRSFVESHSDSDGTTYSVEIRFTYEWEGETYKGENYSLLNSSSSGRASKAAIVRQYPEGSEATCFVNPNDPYEAVITIEVGWLPFALMGFSSIFIGVGLVVLFAGLRSKSGALPDPASSLARNFQSPSERIVLKPKTSRAAKAIFSTFFALFWNGIVVAMFTASGGGGGDTVLFIFSLVFGAIGIGTVVFAFYTWMSLRNPLPTIEVEPGLPRPGEAMRISWSLKGSVSRLESLEVYLEGIETARYQRGTDTVTDENVFFQQPLYETRSRGDFRTGEADITLPANTVPTLKTDHNEIGWHIIFNGKIPRWPDLRETYNLPVFAGRPQKS